MSSISPELFTSLGCAISMFLCAVGSAVASSHSGVFATRQTHWKAFVPIVISGVLSIYGIIISVLLVGKLQGTLTTVDGYRNFSAGLAVGFACLASGYGMADYMKQINQHSIVNIAAARASNGTTGESEPLIGERRVACLENDKTSFWHMTLCMVFLEAIALYGLIVALFLIA
eukprot:Nitzschia sp. Nitz4//scaffold24_size164493//9995//10513//NITZ4_002304-RA/size164493-processed-gene-0.177-mRNA-1//1//CDS//3329544042//5666//frame0